jgi:hypothetical protein
MSKYTNQITRFIEQTEATKQRIVQDLTKAYKRRYAKLDRVHGKSRRAAEADVLAIFAKLNPGRERPALELMLDIRSYMDGSKDLFYDKRKSTFSRSLSYFNADRPVMKDVLPSHGNKLYKDMSLAYMRWRNAVDAMNMDEELKAIERALKNAKAL